MLLLVTTLLVAVWILVALAAIAFAVYTRRSDDERGHEELAPVIHIRSLT